jgi:uroporphyrinogen-III synthase
MHVVITRPRGDAEVLARQLHALGHTTIIEPLIDIGFFDGPPLGMNRVQALLLTSANGARAAYGRLVERDVHVIAVGPATAAEAKALGFTHVTQSTGEGVDGLAQTVCDTLKPTGGTLVHVTGTATAGDLKAALAPAGFTVRAEQMYSARAATSFSKTFTSELTAGRIKAATFFSPRTAATFVTLIEAAKLDASCENVTALALSEAVAVPLRALHFRRVLAAAQPNTAALLDVLKQV